MLCGKGTKAKGFHNAQEKIIIFDDSYSARKSICCVKRVLKVSTRVIVHEKIIGCWLGLLV